MRLISKNQEINQFGTQKWIKNLSFIGFLVIYATFLIYISSILNLSEDETYTLNTTSRGFLGVIHQSYNFEAQPPFYFILLSWWRLLYHGVFFAKLFSILCIGLSAYYFYRIVPLFSEKNISRWMVVIFLLNPFTVWAALEMRLYSLLILLSTSSIYYFFSYYLENKKKSLFYFLIISFFGIYTQYFFAFLVIAFSFIILIFKEWRTFIKYFLYLLPVIFLTLPNLIFIPSEINLQRSVGSELLSFSVIHDIVVYSPKNLILAIDNVMGVWLNRIVRLTIYSAALIAYLKYYKEGFSNGKRKLVRYHLILICIFALLFFFCIAFMITKVGYAPKYLAIVFPLFILTFSIFNIFYGSLGNIIYGSISLYFIILLIIQYKNPVKIYDFKSVANFIESIESPHEPIFVYRPAIAMPLKYYYHGKNPITPIPYPVNFDSNYLINIKDTVELKQSINPANISSKSYLLISDTTSYEGLLNMNRKMVSNYLNHHYKKVLDTFLKGNGKGKSLRIRRFEKP